MDEQRQIDGLIERAWQAFAAGDRQRALSLAEQVCASEPAPPQAAAALGYFLLDDNRLDAAAAVLNPACTGAPHYAPLHWYCGLLALRHGQTRTASEALRRACQLDPMLHEAAFTLAWVLHDLGQLPEALIWARLALTAERTPARLLQTGWLLQSLELYAEASSTYDEAIETLASDAPEQVPLHLHLAQCQDALKQPDAARNTLEDGLASFSDEPALLLELARLTWKLGCRKAAVDIATRLTQRHPDHVAGWHQLGVFQHESGELHAADQAFNEVQQRDMSITDALMRRASLQLDWGRPVDAHWLLEHVLRQQPDSEPAQDLMVRALLDLGRHDEARHLLLRRLRKTPSHSDLWRLLAVVHLRRGRHSRARLALARALRLNPANIEALRTLGWTAHEQDDRPVAVDAALRLLTLRQGESAALIQAAFILAAAGELATASRHAEGAVVAEPANAEAWRALSQVRYQQKRLSEAEDAIDTALELDPARIDSLRQLGWIYVADHRLGHAELAFLRACELAPDNPVILLELAEVRLRAGRFAEGLKTVEALHTVRPEWPSALMLETRLLTESLGACPIPDWRDRVLTRCRQRLDESAPMLVRLLGLGVSEVRTLCALLPWPVWKTACQQALAEAVVRYGNAYLTRLAQISAAAFPSEPWFSYASLYAASLDSTLTPEKLAFQARSAFRQLKLEAGLSKHWGAKPSGRSTARLRIAYIASQQHERLLVPVMAGHDPTQVEVFVYSNLHLAGLPAHVHQHPLQPDELADSCSANQVDVVIDAGGLHPFEGQDLLLTLYARRLAPLQIGWLGCWGTSGGLFDVLLSDSAALPLEHQHGYEEAVWWLEGGQWSWSPPEHAPTPHPPPSLSCGRITFGVTARGLRLNPVTLDTFARIVAAVPESRIRFIGLVSDDWPQRREILGFMAVHGVVAERIEFDPPRGYESLLEWLQQIDLVLDSFPGNGGLSTLDVLWMGVPVVSRAGDWAGARQGLSILSALGLDTWVADSADGFITLAVQLASNATALTAHRLALRQRIRSSSLTDGRRLAQQIEARCTSWINKHVETGSSSDPKQWVRELARRRLETWLEKQAQIHFSFPEDVPALSVIIVLYKQAGLSLRTLQALADQRDTDFEVIIVDNASGAETGQLLDRVQGARIIRNSENHGFLLAANQGAALARGRHLLFLNNDAIVQAGALAQTVTRLEQDRSIGALGGRIVLMSGGLQEAGNTLFRDGSALGVGRGEAPWSPAAMASRDTDYCSGVYLAVPTPLWHMLGGFDPDYAPAYYEDSDFCVRVWQAGFRVVYEPRVLVEHLEWGSASNGEAEQRMRDNRRRFLAKQHNWLAQQPSPRPVPLDGDRWHSPTDNPRKPRILMLENEVPHMARGGGLPRARLVLQALEGWPVTLYPLWRFEDDWEAVYASLPHSTEVMLGPSFGMAGLERFLEQRRDVYDVLWVSRPPNLKALQPLRERRPELFEHMRIIYDSEALFALREIGEAATKGRPLTPEQAEARLQAELEQAQGTYRSVVVSAIDAAHFRSAGHEVATLSHAISVRRDVPDASLRQGLLFVGALHPDTPNEDGLLWFVEEVLPQLRERLPALPRLRVVGECRSNRVAALAGTHLEVLGAQADLAPHYDQARVFIAPARFAGGVPLKVIEAAAHGIPVVASSLLVEQLAWEHGTDIRGAADSTTFAQEIARLLQDDVAWRLQQHAAWATCQTRYAPEQFMSTVRQLVRNAAAGV